MVANGIVNSKKKKVLVIFTYPCILSFLSNVFYFFSVVIYKLFPLESGARFLQILK